MIFELKNLKKLKIIWLKKHIKFESDVAYSATERVEGWVNFFCSIVRLYWKKETICRIPKREEVRKMLQFANCLLGLVPVGFLIFIVWWASRNKKDLEIREETRLQQGMNPVTAFFVTGWQEISALILLPLRLFGKVGVVPIVLIFLFMTVPLFSVCVDLSDAVLDQIEAEIGVDLRAPFEWVGMQIQAYWPEENGGGGNGNDGPDGSAQGVLPGQTVSGTWQGKPYTWTVAQKGSYRASGQGLVSSWCAENITWSGPVPEAIIVQGADTCLPFAQ